MINKQIAFLFFITFTLISCNSYREISETKFRMKSFYKEFKCESNSDTCVSINFQYPDITIARSDSAKNIINNFIKNWILKPVYNDEESFNNFETFADTIIAQYKNLKNEIPDSPLKYTLDRNISVVFNRQNILSLLYDEFSFLGGAHPNTVKIYKNFNMKNVKEIKLSDIFIKDYKSKLNSIGEKKFRELKNISPQENINDAGYWFKDDKFSLNDNFAIKNNGLLFYYNSYEIAPYSNGTTEIFILYKDIKNLINEDGILSEIIN